jgi:uncharacterized paraquat-inducible protein A
VRSCIRCRQYLWPDEEDLCPSCSVAVRVEYRRGLRELEAYLARWREFSNWLHDASSG